MEGTEVLKETFRCKHSPYYIEMTVLENGHALLRDFYFTSEKDIAEYPSCVEARLDAEQLIESFDRDAFRMVNEENTPVVDLLENHNEIFENGPDEMLPLAESKLRALLETGQNFQTSFASVNEEYSFAIIAFYDQILIKAHQQMDGFPELVYDCLDEAETELITDGQINDIEFELEQDWNFTTVADAQEVITRDSDFEEVLAAISRVSDITNSELEKSFGLCTATTKKYMESRRE